MAITPLHRRLGFHQSGVSALDIGLTGSKPIVDLDSGLGTPLGLKEQDAFGINLINNNDYDCSDPVAKNKEYDLGSL